MSTVRRRRPTKVRDYTAVRETVTVPHGTLDYKVPPTVRAAEDVVELLRDIADADREFFVILLLNARHEAVRRHIVSIGSLNASIVHPREVFKPAILASAASLIVAHNHPSGDPEPSDEDLSITKRLRAAGDMLGIAVLDSVIVAVRGYVSLRARNLL